ncbi:MAG TPA: SigE family RNA polymerase sigma factor [Micromonosporaceae bacterium]
MDEGFRDFAMQRLGNLSQLAYLLTGDHHAAEDLLQDALVVVARRWKQVAKADNPVAYVRQILYHEFVSSWRRNRWRRSEITSDQLPEPSPHADEAGVVDRRIVMKRALRRLTPRQRAVVVLRFYEDLSEADAAAVLGCSVGTVKSQTAYALRRLREGSPELADLAPRTFLLTTNPIPEGTI